MWCTLTEQPHGCDLQLAQLADARPVWAFTGLHVLSFKGYETEAWTGSQKESSFTFFDFTTMWWNVAIPKFSPSVPLTSSSLFSHSAFWLWFLFSSRASNYPTVSRRKWLVGASVPVSFLMCYVGEIHQIVCFCFPNGPSTRVKITFFTLIHTFV